MLKYWETNWKSEKGFETHRYEVIFNEVLSHCPVEEQKKRPERLSLVKFFDDKESNYFFDFVCNVTAIIHVLFLTSWFCFSVAIAIPVNPHC